MIETIKINVPEGKKAIYDEETQTIKFIDVEPIRSKSWDEFCKNHPKIKNEYSIDFFGDSIYKISDINRHNRQTFLKTEEDADGIIALIQLTRLHDEWVGDWQISSKEDTKENYYALSYDLMYDELMVRQWWNTQQLLSFPTKEMAKEFLGCFRDLIWRAKRFI